MSGEIRRENFADEANWIEFQANQTELARLQRQRETAQKYAAAGRDYGIIRQINRRIRDREAQRKRYWADPDLARARNRKYGGAWRARHREEERARRRKHYLANRDYYRELGARHRAAYSDYYRTYKARWYIANREHVRQYGRRQWERIKNDPTLYSKRLARSREYLRKYYARHMADPEWRERERVRSRDRYASLTPEQKVARREYYRAYYARKRAEKLAQQQQQAS